MFNKIKQSATIVNANLGFLVCLSIISIISGIIGQLTIPGVGIFIQLFAYFYMLQSMISIKKGKEVGFNNMPEINIKGMIKTFLASIALTVPLLVGLAFYIGILFTSIFSSDGFSIILISSIVMFIITVIYILITSLSFGFTGCICLDGDFESLGVLKSMKMSNELLKGSRLKYVSIQVISCILSFLSIFTLGLACVYIIPLSYMMIVELYYECKQSKLNDNIKQIN